MATLHRKTLQEVAEGEQHGTELSRDYTLFDLVAVGVGGTLGSGVFSLTGKIAAEDAGPAILVSLLIGSLGCLLTAGSYVELSSAIPCSGSVYSYAYVGLGEVFAVIAAAGLTLEYSISGAAVAVSWASKIGKVAHAGWVAGEDGSPVAVAAIVLLAACTALLILGVRESRLFTNIVTVAKCVVVAFMFVCGMILFKPENLTPFVPPSKGVSGILRGSLDSFFGFLGFDEVCCLSGVARNPRWTMPRAVILSVTMVALFTLCAALSLVGMVPAAEIDADAGFYKGFQRYGWNWAAVITAVGEIATLPVVVFVSVLPQSHLFKEMADDGLLPSMFSRVHRGVLMQSTLFVGVLISLMAAFMDFDSLNDMISAGVLLSFILASASVIMVRDVATGGRRNVGGPLLGFTVTSFLGAASIRGLASLDLSHGWGVAAVVLACAAGVALVIFLICAVLLAKRTPKRKDLPSGTHFVTPFGPFFPCLSIVFNAAMLTMLSVSGCLMVVGYFAVTLLVYFGYGRRNAFRRRANPNATQPLTGGGLATCDTCENR